MTDLLREYLPILIFLGIAVAMAVAIVAASYIVAQQRPDSEKVSAYECGFEPFNDSRGQFDVRFYLVAILFVVFDLEAIYFYPWGATFLETGIPGLVAIGLFTVPLVVGLAYEWMKGALEW